MNLFATICLLLAAQGSLALPEINYDNFGPGIREQVRQADRAARLRPRDANAAGQLGMVLHTYEDHEHAVACYSLARWLDYDRDGELDLFVCNYVDFTVTGYKRCYTPTGELDYCAPASYKPVPDRLFRNEGKGKFADVSQHAGINRAIGPALGVVSADFNGDGWLDLYVANDGAANHLWLNQQDGTFEESGLLAGAAYSLDGIARAGMGVTAGDIDNDGDEDLLVTNLTRQGSTLQMNNGKAVFNDASLEFNLAQPTFLSTGFGVGWFDYDNDGWLDLFAANGAVTLLPALRGEPYPFHQRNQLFHNEAGKRFVEVTASSLSEVSRGAVFGDIDNDGDLDILVTNNNGSVRLLLNTNNDAKAKSAHWLTLQLQGTKDNRLGLGARVGLLRQGEWQWRRAHTDGSYLCASDPRVHFGLGKSAKVEALAVQWPSGLRERWSGVAVDRIHILRQGTGVAESSSPR